MRQTLYIPLVFTIVAISIFYPVLSLFSSSGVNILFEFHSRNGYLKNWLGRPVLPGDRVYVDVYAIAPPTYDVSEVRIWNGTLDRPYLTIPYSGRFKRVIDDLYKYLVNSPVLEDDKQSIRYGLRIDIWVFANNGTVISDTRYITYSPWIIRGGGVEDRVLEIDLANPTLKYNIASRLEGHYGAQQVTESTASSLEPLTSSVCVWLPEWDVTPNDLAESGAPYTVVNGVKYVEIPVAIVENKYYYSGSIAFSFELDSTYTTALTASIGVGYDLSSKVASGSYDVGTSG